MGRIIDLRDPDDYIPYEVYSECVRNAEEATNREIAKLEKEANEKLSEINIAITIKKWKGTDFRTYADIFCITNGQNKKIHCSRLSDGADLKKDVQNCLKSIVCEHFGISLMGE